MLVLGLLLHNKLSIITFGGRVEAPWTRFTMNRFCSLCTLRYVDFAQHVLGVRIDPGAQAMAEIDSATSN